MPEPGQDPDAFGYSVKSLEGTREAGTSGCIGWVAGDGVRGERPWRPYPPHIPRDERVGTHEPTSSRGGRKRRAGRQGACFSGLALPRQGPWQVAALPTPAWGSASLSVKGSLPAEPGPVSTPMGPRRPPFSPAPICDAKAPAGERTQKPLRNFQRNRARPALGAAVPECPTGWAPVRGPVLSTSVVSLPHKSRGQSLSPAWGPPPDPTAGLNADRPREAPWQRRGTWKHRCQAKKAGSYPPGFPV